MQKKNSLQILNQEKNWKINFVEVKKGKAEQDDRTKEKDEARYRKIYRRYEKKKDRLYILYYICILKIMFKRFEEKKHGILQ